MITVYIASWRPLANLAFGASLLVMVNLAGCASSSINSSDARSTYHSPSHLMSSIPTYSGAPITAPPRRASRLVLAPPALIEAQESRQRTHFVESAWERSASCRNDGSLGMHSVRHIPTFGISGIRVEFYERISNSNGRVNVQSWVKNRSVRERRLPRR